jgi:hypothetical protein
MFGMPARCSKHKWVSNKKNGLIIVTCERAASKELVRTVLRDRFHGLLFKLVQPSVRDLLEVPSVKFTEERNLLMVLVQLACKP